MRKIIVLSFISLDGVMQAPGGPQEDTEGNFKFGGWVVPYFDEAAGRVMDEQMGKPFDLLLGRKTYDIFASYWPSQTEEAGAEPLNKAVKYVASTTLTNPTWEKTIILKDVVSELKTLKNQEGPDLQVHGSSNFIQTLMKNDLIDEYWLKIFPVTLGSGKKLFGTGTFPASFTLEKCETTPKGVIVAYYKRSGNVETGLFGE